MAARIGFAGSENRLISLKRTKALLAEAGRIYRKYRIEMLHERIAEVGETVFKVYSAKMYSAESQKNLPVAQET